MFKNKNNQALASEIMHDQATTLQLIQTEFHALEDSLKKNNLFENMDDETKQRFASIHDIYLKRSSRLIPKLLKYMNQVR